MLRSAQEDQVNGLFYPSFKKHTNIFKWLLKVQKAAMAATSTTWKVSESKVPQ